MRELAQTLGRDYKNVHQDVATLQAAGLLVRDGRKLTAPWDELQANVSLMKTSTSDGYLIFNRLKRSLLKPGHDLCVLPRPALQRQQVFSL